MKILRRTLWIVVALLFIVLVLGWSMRGYLLRRSLPGYNGVFTMKGLQGEVTVYRDSFAVPHIYATNTSDLYRVSGYLEAQDRLWQMDLFRRVTEGRLSEIFGKGLVKTDMLMRMLRIPEKSRQVMAQTDSSILESFKAFAEGVNQYISEHRDKLPPEFAILGYKPEPWKVENSFNLIGYIAWDLNGSWKSEILLHKLAAVLTPHQLETFLPREDSTLSVIYRYGQNRPGWRDIMAQTSEILDDLGLRVFHGSNNWAIDGSRTVSGKPMLANDMHLGFSLPGIWYQMHQVIPGKLNVTGVAIPGAPIVVSGHNDSIAWGLTNVMNDDIDFYREVVDSARNAYKFDGKWHKFQIMHEVIPVKNSDSVFFDLQLTHHGPVISQLAGFPGETISMHWMGNEMSNEVRSIYLLNRAHNWTDFKEAMKTFIAISQNAAYADVKGNIGLYCCAGVPVRKAGNPADVLPGDTSLYDWQGIVPFDELPHLFNPADGFVISANNRTTDSAFHYYISYWFDFPFRYNRIAELIQAKRRLGVADFKRIQTDQNSWMCRLYLPEIIRQIRMKHISNATENFVLDTLARWNGNMAVNSLPAAVFDVFYGKFVQNLVGDELGPSLYAQLATDKIMFRNVFHNAFTGKAAGMADDVKTMGKQEKLDDIAYRSFQEALAYCKETMGNDPSRWEWGRIHTVTFENPLGKNKMLDRLFHLHRGPFPVGGSFHTIAPYTYDFNKPFAAGAGASQRHIYNTADWDESYTVIPSGTSGISSSPYYGDQINLYVKGLYHRDHFSEPSVVKSAEFKAVFKP